MRMTACTTPVLSRARSSSHITRNFTAPILPEPSTDPRQWVTDQHVYHAGAAELGVHYDHPCGLLADLTDDLGLLAALDATQRLQGGLCGFGSDDGEQLAFVGDVERVYPQNFARPVHDRSEEHTSELQSRQYLVCRLLLEKKKNYISQF